MSRTPGNRRGRIPRIRVALCSLAVLGLLLLPQVLSGRNLRLATEVLIWALFVVSMNFLLRQGGMVTLGHAAYWSIGAYAYGLAVARWDVAPWIAMIAAPFVAAVVGLILGAVAVRRSHAYFVLLTFALGGVVYTVTFGWRSLTRGDDGLLGVIRPEWFASDSVYYIFTAVAVLVSTAIIYFVSESSFGYKLLASKDAESRAASSGMNVYVHRLLAFGFACFFAGVAGALWAGYQGSVFPDIGYWLHSAEGLVMIAIGGSASFLGPVLGAIIYTSLSRIVAVYTPYWLFVLGVVLLVVALIGLDGITGFARRWRERRQVARSGSVTGGDLAIHGTTEEGSVEGAVAGPDRDISVGD